MVGGFEFDGGCAEGGDGGEEVGVAAKVVGAGGVGGVEGDVAVAVGPGRVGGELGEAEVVKERWSQEGGVDEGGFVGKVGG